MAQHLFIGLFLIIMGFAMFTMTAVYDKTNRLNLSWSCFGVLYTLGILLLFTNNPIKDQLHIVSTKQFFSIASLVILFVGIMLSYIIFSKKGERYIIAGVLFSVGVHFIPFDSIYTYILAILIIVNAISVFFKETRSIIQVCAIDAMLKIVLGICLIFYL